jgi:integrase
MPKISVIRDNIVDEFEIVRILQKVKGEQRLLFAVAMAWETGARVGELVQLRQKDFSEEGDLWLCSVPTLKQRVKIHGQEPKRLLKIKKDDIYEKIIKPIVLKQTDPNKPIVFPNTRDMLASKLKRKYPDVYFHWFRHSRATLWSRKLDIFTLQYAMGWQDIRMANIYVHQEQMSNKMGGILLET